MQKRPGDPLSEQLAQGREEQLDEEDGDGERKDRNHHRFHHDLPHEIESRGPYHFPHSDLLRPNARPSRIEDDKVDAGDKKNQDSDRRVHIDIRYVATWKDIVDESG